MRRVKDTSEGSNSFDRKFRNTLRNYEVEAPIGPWERVEATLENDIERRRYDHWYQALLMLLIPITLANLFVSYNLNEGQFNPHQQLAVNKVKALKPLPLYSSTGIVHRGVNDFNIIGQALFDNKDRLNSEPASGSKTESAYEPVNEVPFFASNDDDFVGNNIDVIDPLKLQNDLLEDMPLRSESYHNNKSVLRGFYFGVDGGLTNSWMAIRKDALAPLVGNDINRKIDWGYYYGISVGYNFSDKFGMEAEWVINSRQGERHTEMRYGKLLSESDINLNYMHFPVLFKYKWTKLSSNSRNPRVWNLIGGVQYSRLKKASMKYNMKKGELDLPELTGFFPHNELGLVLGVEYDFFVNENYYVTFGFRGSVSSDATAFPYFSSRKPDTYNFLLGVNTSINYLIRNKKR